jgi:P27 family predicted phage terminase small subunit
MPISRRSGAGRKPTPFEVLKAKGTDRADRHQDNDHAFQSVELIEAPSHLSAEAKRIYLSIGKELTGSGILKTTDLPAFTSLCTLLGLEIETIRDMEKWEQEMDARYALAIKRKNNKDGTKISTKRPRRYVTTIDGESVLNPYVKILNQLLPEIGRARAEFGMTPSSRTRIKVDWPVKKSAFSDF